MQWNGNGVDLQHEKYKEIKNSFQFVSEKIANKSN